MVDESSRLAFQLSMGRLLVHRYSSGDRNRSRGLSATVAEFGGAAGHFNLAGTAAVFRGRPRWPCHSRRKSARLGGPGAAEAAWCSNTEVPLAGLGTETRLCKRPGGG